MSYEIHSYHTQCQRYAIPYHRLMDKTREPSGTGAGCSFSGGDQSLLDDFHSDYGKIAYYPSTVPLPWCYQGPPDRFHYDDYDRSL